MWNTVGPFTNWLHSRLCEHLKCHITFYQFQWSRSRIAWSKNFFSKKQESKELPFFNIRSKNPCRNDHNPGSRTIVSTRNCSLISKHQKFDHEPNLRHSHWGEDAHSSLFTALTLYMLTFAPEHYKMETPMRPNEVNNRNIFIIDLLELTTDP